MDYPDDDHAEHEEPEGRDEPADDTDRSGDDRAADRDVERSPNPVNRALIIALGVAVGAIVALVIGLLSVRADRDDVDDRFAELAAEQRAEADASVVAQEFLTALFNFDHQTIDEDFDRIVSYATGEFEDGVARFNEEETRQGIRDLQAQSRGEIVDLFVQEIEGDRAHFFAVVDQTIQNSERGLVNDTVRLELGLVREGDTWKVFDLRTLPAAGTLGSGGLTPVPSGDPPADGSTTTTSTPTTSTTG